MTITTVSTSAALVSALKVAQAGDTIQLAAGTYSPVSLSNLHFANDVTVTSLDPSHAAVINGLYAVGESASPRKTTPIITPMGTRR